MQNPIHAVTGNKFQSETDLASLPGKLGLTFTRHYNSQTDYNAWMGVGWSHSYEVKLYKDGKSYRIRQSDGRVVKFQRIMSEEQNPGSEALIRVTAEALVHARTVSESNHYSGVLVSDGMLKIHAHGAVWQWRNGRKLHFNRLGRLTGIEAPGGNNVNLAYSNTGRLRQVTDPQGRSLSLRYHPSGRIQSMIDPAANTTSYEYDKRGNLIKVTYADNSTRQYHYEDPSDAHNLTGITNENGIRYASYTYDDKDRAIRTRHAENVGDAQLEFQKGKTSVTNSLGQTSTYHTEYKRGIALVTQIDGPGCSDCGAGDTKYNYNNRLQLISSTAKNGITTYYNYDNQGRTRLVYASSGDTRRLVAAYEYQDNSLLPSVVKRLSVNPEKLHTINITYDAQGNITSLRESGYAQQPDSSYRQKERIRSYTYDNRGRLIAADEVRDDVNDVTRIIRDRKGRIRKIIFPDGGVQEFLAYDKLGRITQLKTDGRTPLAFTYTVRGDMASVGNINGSFQYVYTPTRKLQRSIDPARNGVRLEYDAADRLIKRINNVYSLTYTYNTENQLLRKQWLQDDQPFSTLEYHYDDQNRLIELKNQSGDIVRRYEYSKNKGIPREVLGPASNTDYQYDPMGQLTAIVTPDGIKQEFDAVVTQRLVAVTDANGNTTRYGLSDFGQGTYIDSPDSGITRYDYDPAGNLIAKTDANGNKAQFKYDVTDKLMGLTLSEQTFSAAYKDGKLAMFGQSGNAESWKYDEDGRPISFTRHLGNSQYTTSYTYDEASGRVSATTLPDGTRMLYIYGTNGQNEVVLSGIQRESIFGSDEIIRFDSSNAQESRYSYGNGITTTWRYAKNRLASIDITGLHDLSYHYNQADQIIGIDRNDNIYQRYRYNKYGQLDFALTPHALYGYRYDANGNRARKVVNGVHFNYAIDTKSNRIRSSYIDIQSTQSNGLIKVSSGPRKDRITRMLNPQYDSNGGLIAMGNTRIEYNSNGQPKVIYNDKGMIARYEYNANAERIKKTVYYTRSVRSGHSQSAEITQFLYENSKLAAEIDSQGYITRQYLYAGTHPVAILENDSTYAVHTNHLGAPIAVSNEQQVIIWRAEYDPYGRAYVEYDPDKNGESFELNLRLPGQYEDKETGLYYNIYRYYDPDLGRYISSDPLGLKAGLNTYTYVKNNPVHNIDPTGLLLFAFDGTGNTNNIDDLKGNLNSNSNVERFRRAYLGPANEIPIPFDWQARHQNAEFGPDAGAQGYNYDNEFYVTGVGRRDPYFGTPTTGLALDLAGGFSLIERTYHQVDNLLRYLDFIVEERATSEHSVMIDIVGFSRGAAEARHFANLVDDIIEVFVNRDNFTGVEDVVGIRDIVRQITRRSVGSGASRNSVSEQNNYLQRVANTFQYLKCQNITFDLNFLGLFDTVPHYKINQDDDLQQLRLRIPERVSHAVHAVSVDEQREGFAGVSIHNSPETKNTASRIELGFLGAHADIGGGYPEGDLSDVALNWIIQQAKATGVEINDMLIENQAWHIVNDPIVHDSLGVLPLIAYGPGREFKFLNGESIDQRLWQSYNLSEAKLGLDTSVTKQLFDERFILEIQNNGRNISRMLKGVDGDGDRTLVGAVNIAESGNNINNTYQQWLKENYNLDITINHQLLDVRDTSRGQ